MSYRYHYRPTGFYFVYILYILFLFLLTISQFASATYMDDAHQRASVYIDALVSRYGSQGGHTLTVSGIQRLVDRIEFGQGKFCDGTTPASENQQSGTVYSTEESSNDATDNEINTGRETTQPSVPERTCNESQFLCAATKVRIIVQKYPPRIHTNVHTHTHTHT